jgi:hypothetical protein
MPLPYALDHINLWGLDDLAGLGARRYRNTDEVGGSLAQLFANAPDRRPLTHLRTHMHPDHAGLAGPPSPTSVRMTPGPKPRNGPTPGAKAADAIQFYRRAGWQDAAIETYRARFGNRRHPSCDSYATVRWPGAADGADAWRVVVGNGHSRACVPALPGTQATIRDQVLPRISSNVSVIRSSPTPIRWDLARLARQGSASARRPAQPSHNECRGCTRIDRLSRVQDRLLGCCASWRSLRAVDVFSTLFARSIGQ